jgi:hypothetical protein
LERLTASAARSGDANGCSPIQKTSASQDNRKLSDIYAEGPDGDDPPMGAIMVFGVGLSKWLISSYRG